MPDNEKLIDAIKEYFNGQLNYQTEKLAAIERKQNEVLAILQDHVDVEEDRWAIKKEFITYARKILDRFVKKFMLFRDDVNVKSKPEVE